MGKKLAHRPHSEGGNPQFLLRKRPKELSLRKLGGNSSQYSSTKRAARERQLQRGQGLFLHKKLHGEDMGQ